VKYKNKHSVKHKDKERDRRKKKQSVKREEIKNNKINGLHRSRHASGSIYFPTRGWSPGKTVQIPSAFGNIQNCCPCDEAYRLIPCLIQSLISLPDREWAPSAMSLSDNQHHCTPSTKQDHTLKCLVTRTWPVSTSFIPVKEKSCKESRAASCMNYNLQYIFKEPSIQQQGKLVHLVDVISNQTIYNSNFSPTLPYST